MKLLTRIHRLIRHGGPVELVKGAFRFVYWQSGLRETRHALGYKLHGSSVTKTIKNTTASFEVSTPAEYARANTLHNERSVIANVLQSLNSDDVFYDIGANIGTYACFVGQLLDDGSVIAFEPHPANIKQLQENAALNNVQVKIRPVALSNEHGTSKLDVSGEDDQAGVGTHSLSTGDTGRTIQIDMVEGDRLIEAREIPPPTVMKIDVEGAEQLILEGLTSTLESERCHTIYCEVHPDRISDFGGSEQELRELLKINGYTIQIIKNRSPEYFLKAYQENK